MVYGNVSGEGEFCTSFDGDCIRSGAGFASLVASRNSKYGFQESLEGVDVPQVVRG